MKEILDFRTKGHFAGNGVHRNWRGYALNGCGLTEFGHAMKTSRYVLSAKAVRKDGSIRKLFVERLQKALSGDLESQQWLAKRDCYLLVA